MHRQDPLATSSSPFLSSSPASCLMRVVPEADGRFTAHVPGEADLRVSAASSEEAIKELRGRLLDEMYHGQLVAVDLTPNPIMERFGSARDDPTFNEYLEEIRKFREEADRLEGRDLGSDECSSPSSTPII